MIVELNLKIHVPKIHDIKELAGLYLDTSQEHINTTSSTVKFACKIYL